ncbi:Hypothetical predicted protein [Marmota monax]|uniref:Protein FAM210A n=1 Tax=Marmota monax TaxID=9995 RepID=A0A5E4B2M0_MARMO|nr:Hypothetical predicted protein [Marmota monax]
MFERLSSGLWPSILVVGAAGIGGVGLSIHPSGKSDSFRKKEDFDPLQDKSRSLYQRFKKTFRQYGKVLIPVHLMTSGVWFGAFDYAARRGLNAVPVLELLGLPDSVVNTLKKFPDWKCPDSKAMFKIATPALHRDLGRTVLYREVIAQLWLHVDTTSCQGVSVKQDGRDQAQTH